jgi:hypothetical protein
MNNQSDGQTTASEQHSDETTTDENDFLADYDLSEEDLDGLAESDLPAAKWARALREFCR